MSNHLEHPALTTTSTKKRKEKITKAKQQELENGWKTRNRWLKDLHLPKETFDQYLEWVYGKGKKTKTEKNVRSTHSKTSSYPTLKNEYESLDKVVEDNGINNDSIPTHGKLWITGAVSSKPSPTYTGSKVIGIGTLHKSNAVPIFSNEEAIEISSMRR